MNGKKMNKSTKNLMIITLVILWMIMGLPILITLVTKQFPAISITEEPLGIAWGTDRKDASILMQKQGYMPLGGDVSYTNKQIYTVSNFQNVEGLNGMVILSFDEAGGLSEVILDFKAQSSNGVSISDQVDPAYMGIRKTLNKQYTKMSYDSLEGYEYWSGEKTFYTLIYKKGTSLTLAFSPGDSILTYSEQINNSQKKD